MDSKFIKAFSDDLQNALAQVLVKHGFHMAKISSVMTASKDLVITLHKPKLTAATAAQSDEQPTPNAVKRYQKSGAALGLPVLGTVLAVAGKNYELVGLSTDSKRVKARATAPGAKVVDLLLGDVLQATTLAAGASVAKMEAAEAAAPDDVIDPGILAQLASIAKKPAEGQQ